MLRVSQLSKLPLLLSSSSSASAVAQAEISIAPLSSKQEVLEEGATNVGGGTSFGDAGLAVGVCSRQGKRPYQEDEPAVRAYLSTSPETHFFGLFDGHAGGRCSKFVSSVFADTLVEDKSFNTNLSHALRRTFHTVNDQFLKLAERLRLQDGSTGICVVLRDGKLIVGNVGDCRAVLISSGRPIQLSKDQKPTMQEEQKRIISLGGSVVYCMGVARVNGVLAVSRAFGNRSLRSVIRPDAEMTHREITREDDFLVLASDGLWDVLRNKDVCDVCYAKASLGTQVLADELVALALARGSMDNVTCIVIRLSKYANRNFEEIKKSSPIDVSKLIPDRSDSGSDVASNSGSRSDSPYSLPGASSGLSGSRSHGKRLSALQQEKISSSSTNRPSTGFRAIANGRSHARGGQLSHSLSRASSPYTLSDSPLTISSGESHDNHPTGVRNMFASALSSWGPSFGADSKTSSHGGKVAASEKEAHVGNILKRPTGVSTRTSGIPNSLLFKSISNAEIGLANNNASSSSASSMMSRLLVSPVVALASATSFQPISSARLSSLASSTSTTASK